MIHKAWANINNWYTSLLHDMRFATTASATKGFTIVELLIVIVVIGILAAIIIIAYLGVTNKANTSKAQENAAGVSRIMETFNADKGYYPALAASGTDSITTYSGSSRLPSGVSVIPEAASEQITAANGKTTVAYSCLTSCTNSTGGRLTYWNFTTGAVAQIYVGAAGSSGTFVYPAT